MEENRKDRLRRLNTERVRRYREKHNKVVFSVPLSRDLKARLVKRLEIDGMTHEMFILKAFDFYKRNGGFPSDTSEDVDNRQ